MKKQYSTPDKKFEGVVNKILNLHDDFSLVYSSNFSNVAVIAFSEDKYRMSVVGKWSGEIQIHLKSKEPVCDYREQHLIWQDLLQNLSPDACSAILFNLDLFQIRHL